MFVFSLIRRSSINNNINEKLRQKVASCCNTVEATAAEIVEDANKAVNESNRKSLFKNKDSWIESELEVSNNGNFILSSNKDRLFAPFSKVVEPINGQIMMTMKKNQDTEEQIKSLKRHKKEIRFQEDGNTYSSKLLIFIFYLAVLTNAIGKGILGISFFNVKKVINY